MAQSNNTGSVAVHGRLCAPAAALLLAACVTQPAKPVGNYVPPSAGSTARFVMRGSVPAGDRYGVFVLDDAEHCGGHRLVGSGDVKRNPVTTTLAANQIQTVEFRLLKPNRQFCAIRWSFTPVAGKTYLLRGSGQVSSCAALVMDMTDPEQIKPEPTALRRNPGTSACLPISQSKGLSVAGADSAQTGQDAVLRQGVGTEDLQGLIGQ